eukprot:TRINITY_DN19157_c0_g1_i1.p1 TRINITY_DN19157_c0_g1~~TRINITY_DN19157_c0_g1_i1.p1  ORF type:complete len:539 (-),score=131.36 TRINITY_DN19157_c0_g1_i1:647-2263(-)
MDESCVRGISSRLSSLADISFPHALEVRGDSVSKDEKEKYLVDLLRRDAAVFLERYGSKLSVTELNGFDPMREDYEVAWHLKQLKATSVSEGNGRALATMVKNRRLAYMSYLTQETPYFSEDAIRERCPLLHHEYIGRFQDPASRSQARRGETWSETLIRRCRDEDIDHRLASERERAIEEGEDVEMEDEVDEEGEGEESTSGEEDSEEESESGGEDEGRQAPIFDRNRPKPEQEEEMKSQEEEEEEEEERGDQSFRDALPPTSSEPQTEQPSVAASHPAHPQQSTPSPPLTSISITPLDTSNVSQSPSAAPSVARAMEMDSQAGKSPAKPFWQKAKRGVAAHGTAVVGRKIPTSAVQSGEEKGRWGEIASGGPEGGADVASRNAGADVARIGETRRVDVFRAGRGVATGGQDLADRLGAGVHVGRGRGGGIMQGMAGVQRSVGPNRVGSEGEEEEGKEGNTEVERFGSGRGGIWRSQTRESMEARMNSLRRIMQEKFLAGEDENHVDYKKIDSDVTLDDNWLQEISRDAEEKYFEQD